jgi:hypothetical protein
MKRGPGHLLWRQIFAGFVWAVLFFVSFFSQPGTGANCPIWYRRMLDQLQVIFQDTLLQSVLAGCLAFQFFALLSAQNRIHGIKYSHRWWWSNICLTMLVILVLISFESTQDTLQGPPPLIVLLGSIDLGLGAFILVSQNIETKDWRTLAGWWLLCLLALGSWHLPEMNGAVYHGRIRWTGFWDSPNSFGLLMGTGSVIALGMLIQNAACLRPGKSWVVQHWKACLTCVGCLLFLVLMARGLVLSYSRGAWFATACSICYLARASIYNGQKPGLPGSSRLKRSFPAIVVLSVAAAILCFWHFGHTNWLPGQRAFSAVNTADFSWRNRITAWTGAFQIAAEHSWFGTGWNQSEELYDKYYLPAKLFESTAVKMNDYLMLMVALGVPALFAFGTYLWLTLTGKAECREQKVENQNAETSGTRCPALNQSPPSAFCLQPFALTTTCRAGAIVLTVGFWFDGGLFKLATASTFWILLELGNVNCE